MGIVHHSNHVRYFELARIAWLEEHDEPYQRYVESGLHFATTRVEVDYHRPVRFADVVEITVWAEAVRFASLRMAYVLRVAGETIATGVTEHAAVDGDGKVCRLPKPRRAALLTLLGKNE
jgi:acyl-CoA thioester hydrolase